MFLQAYCFKVYVQKSTKITIVFTTARFLLVEVILKLKWSMCPEPHDIKRTAGGGAVLRCAQQWNLGG